MAAEKLHVDDTPVPVLAPGMGKTKTGGFGSTSGDSLRAGHATKGSSASFAPAVTISVSFSVQIPR
jgi:hypothetical protein